MDKPFRANITFFFVNCHNNILIRVHILIMLTLIIKKKFDVDFWSNLDGIVFHGFDPDPPVFLDGRIRVGSATLVVGVQSQRP